MSDFPIDALRNVRDPLVPAYRRIADELRRVIVEHGLAPGTKLPSETQLVARYDVARMTAREALRVLKVEGVVRSEQGRGVFVESTPAPRAIQMGQTTESNEGEWRERVHAALASGDVEVAEADDPWASRALGASESTGIRRLVAVSVRIEQQPGRSERVTIFIPGSVRGAGRRAAEALARSKRWTVSVRSADEAEYGDLRVTRIAHDARGPALLAARSIRAGGWPVTTTEII